MDHLLSIEELGQDGVERVLDRANGLRNGAEPTVGAFTACALFLQPSVRTRVGHTAAIARLGGTVIDVFEPRYSPGMSAAESFDDTLRTVSGMVDLVLCRAPVDLSEHLDAAVVPVVNCGDAAGRHPTQALLDIDAMQRFSGPVDQLHIGLCGDLTQRAARSLVQALGFVPPRELTLMGHPRRDLDPSWLPESLGPVTRRATPAAVTDLDVLYMVGFPPGQGEEHIGIEERSQFFYGSQMARRLPPAALVLSPLPVIDEVAAEVRGDPRLRMFDQSDNGLWTRMAASELLLEGLPPG